MPALGHDLRPVVLALHLSTCAARPLPRPLLRNQACNPASAFAALEGFSRNALAPSPSGRPSTSSLGLPRGWPRVPGRSLGSSGGRRLAAGRVGTVAAMALEKVQISRNGDEKLEFDAYVSGPVGAPGVIVVQEWWGVDYEIKNHASHLAGLGYRALIPDLYRGKVALEVAEAEHLLGGLDWPGAVKDIEASAKWLKENGSAKVGVIGFCMGGALSIAAAVRADGIDAAVPFYGIPPPELADPAKAKAPVQGHFGDKDKYKGFSDLEAAKALEAKLKESGVASEVFIYPGQGHAFMNASEEGIKRKLAGGNEPHDEAAVKLAWERVDSWLSKYLK